LYYYKTKIVEHIHHLQILLKFTFMPKTYLISGAGSGIGRAITQKLSASNHTCIVLGRTENTLKETLKMLSGNNHQILLADVRDKN